MKTLDEVIAELEDEGLFADALHYLKEYRDRKETLRNWTEKAISEQQNLSDAITFMQAYRDDKDDLTALRAYRKEQQENNALTWEQLKQMEGKPVWVEEKPDNEWIGYWNVVKRLETFDDGSESILFISSEYYDEENYGIEWQAYRKERE